jgi:hypothetical protein
VSRWFEDFTVGDVYRSRFGRTVTEYDNVLGRSWLFTS